ncbi:nucleoside-diphosphate kinase, partial [Candidatus Woesearchaeota archaeon]|nr:nucleoside-diphosphate kinase [Candidatus Woesearchaeota archaeon]
MIQKTLVLVKPDGVRRGLVGEILRRFETKGLKLIGLKMQWIDEDFAKKHYTEDI